MKVLFVSGGYSKSYDLSPIIKNQGESLRYIGVDIEYYQIIGKGFIGYLKSMYKLRKHLRKNHYDLVHAHYVLSGWAAVLASGKVPVIVSFMGSDVYGKHIGKNKVALSSKYITVLAYLIQPFVSLIISKSQRIEKYVIFKSKSSIIPNGVNLELFQANKTYYFKQEHNLDDKKKYILFLGNKNNPIKNIKLVYNAVKLLDRSDIELINPFPVKQNDIVGYLNLADVLVLPSYAEGSPNVVKEAMACNCPVVSTDVGDVRWLFGDEPGYFISGFDPEEFASEIKIALEYSRKNGRTNGRKRIIKLGLDSMTIASKVRSLYEKIVIK